MRQISLREELTLIVLYSCNTLLNKSYRKLYITQLIEIPKR